MTPVDDDQRIIIRPEGESAQGPDQGLLRTSSTGDPGVTRDCDADPKCFVDECVPQGTYQYGYAEPYECSSASCGTYFFDEASVTTALDATCQRSTGRTGPQSFTGQMPWGNQQQICGYGGGPSCASVPGSAAVFLLSAGARGGGGLALPATPLSLYALARSLGTRVRLPPDPRGVHIPRRRRSR